MKVDTILFDLDGTLINTNELIIASFTHTLEHYCPQTYSREDIISFIGLPLIDSFKEVDESSVAEMVKMYKAHNLAHHEQYVHAFEGVVDTVKVLHEKGFKLGIVTTKMRDAVELGLEITGLSDYFTTIVTLDDVEQAKPHPEPIFKALDKLQADVNSAIMVGDSRYDIEAGKNAGTMTAAVAWTIKGRESLELRNPDFMLEEMSDLLRVLEVEVVV
ncbi:pyrophosphatase PpaX [Pseudalkalibacillus berkeleyi]|uniref:Pyrophosphatase PpaX n=1 Tax=Pseudalkalibacillus berkeleyi TaxID=1069813 RepID=A0ABS9H4H9_9BACL|nr:pyrophosphatase PpaX [Pseudalkalibacillus berkeleyi]MCF6138698.1 pyrophosphatase PpaX [Pseudalkalibacillus berkeleyi]